MNRKLYALHRWVSLLALLQLLAWSISGLFFAIVPEARVKGSPASKAHSAPLAGPLAGWTEVMQTATAALGQPPERIDLVGTPTGPVFLARAGKSAVRLEARTGALSPIEQEEAGRIAQRDQPGTPAIGAIRKIDKDTPLEYRGRPAPVWLVELADRDDTHVYVDARTGEVTARRNATWRVYDFLWSLHIMDYREREDFRHPLLVIAAVLAVTTAATGSVLWLLRFSRWKTRRQP
ncbi:MAG: PepSY domain-containing protein [Polyangiaceae bacterium]|jgi:uncharacterized iron-regulated membrane protein|nr:PepSY domain-containing protein [Polyangiaceae bacterium]